MRAEIAGTKRDDVWLIDEEEHTTAKKRKNTKNTDSNPKQPKRPANMVIAIQDMHSKIGTFASNLVATAEKATAKAEDTLTCWASILNLHLNDVLACISAGGGPGLLYAPQ